jgi:hypothetical protein
MSFVAGVHLLPSTGEFTYDTIAHQGQRLTGSMLPLNTFFAPGGSHTDYSTAIDQLQAAYPACATVSVVCAWFGSSLDASACQIYPSTTFIGGAFEQLSGGSWAPDTWRVSGLTQASPGLIAIPSNGDAFIYGGTPSDQSIVRCIRDLKTRGFRVVFYPFILMTSAGLPWRGNIAYSADISSAATAAVNAFLGPAATSDFTPDLTNLTVAYSGSPTDYSYRRMILHYAWLCTIAGGVDLFMLGSELRGLEIIRGPGWTRAGTTDGSGHAIWDYPFVAGLETLANDVRSIFDGQGLTKNLSGLKNLIAYSADWSDWMGYQHPGEDGQWPHLDQLFASANVDLVGFDNYLPLSDWTTQGGLDVDNWNAPAPSGAWPPSPAAMNGLGLSGAPTLYALPYLKANIEGGEKFNWFYNDGANDGIGLDPLGSDQQISRPDGDRLAQSRNPYFSNQQLLANKQFRWWWNNAHHAIYDDGDGTGWSPRGPQTQWQAQSKSIAFIEYGFPATDKGTNQPNVFYNPASVESFTPYWSVWESVAGGSHLPLRDDTIPLLALQAIYEHWNVDGNNETSGAGVPMIQFAFSCVWNWDARPFPTFPVLDNAWGDAGNWAAGQWLPGRGPATPPTPPSSPPSPGSYPTFPNLATLGWSTIIRPRFGTDVIDLVSGRSTRRARYAAALYDVELTYEVLRTSEVPGGETDCGSVIAYPSSFVDCGAPTDPVVLILDCGIAIEDSGPELQAIAGFFAQTQGQAGPFWLSPPDLADVAGQALGIADGVTTSFPLVRGFGSYSEPVPGTSGVTAIYENGALVPSAFYTVTSGYQPAVVFATAPAAGLAISADFGLLWLCRFADDILDLEEFMAMLFALRMVKLQTVRF